MTARKLLHIALGVIMIVQALAQSSDEGYTVSRYEDRQGGECKGDATTISYSIVPKSIVNLTATQDCVQYTEGTSSTVKSKIRDTTCRKAAGVLLEYYPCSDRECQNCEMRSSQVTTESFSVAEWNIMHSGGCYEYFANNDGSATSFSRHEKIMKGEYGGLDCTLSAATGRAPMLILGALATLLHLY